MPLDGLWLRAPYLHNGSVPTLRALLFPDERPLTFYRGYDVYDWKSVGFVSSGADAERDGVRFDTSERGNGNAGHLYGTTRSREEKEALLEYLKTSAQAPRRGKCSGKQRDERFRIVGVHPVAALDPVQVDAAGRPRRRVDPRAGLLVHRADSVALTTWTSRLGGGASMIVPQVRAK